MLRIYFRASHILVKALLLRASPKTIFSSVFFYKFNLIIFFLDHVKECYLFNENKNSFIQYIQITVSLSLISFQILPTIQLHASFLSLFGNKQEIKKLTRTKFLKIKHEKYIQTFNPTPPQKKTLQHWKHNIQAKDWQGGKCPNKAIWDEKKFPKKPSS